MSTSVTRFFYPMICPYVYSMPIRRIIIIFVLSFFVLATYGQTEQKAYKSSVYRKEKSSPLQPSVRQLLNEAKLLQEKRPKEAIDKVEEALLISIKSKNTANESECYLVLGEINNHLKQWALATENFNLSESILDKQNLNHYNRLRLGRANSNMQQGQLDLAEKDYQDLLDNASNEKEKTQALNGLGEVLIRKGQGQKAEQSFKQALDLNLKSDNREEVSKSKANLARSSLAQKKVREAEEYLEESQEIANEANNLSDDDYLLINETNEEISQYYRDNDIVDKELELRSRSTDFNEAKGNSAGVVKQKVEISRILLDNGDTEGAIENLKPVTEANQNKPSQERVKALGILSEAYEKQGDYDNSLETYKNYVAEKESLFKTKEIQLEDEKSIVLNQRKITSRGSSAKLQNKDDEIRDRELLLKEAEVQQQKLLNYGLLFIIGVVCVAGFFVYRNAKERRLANQLLTLKSLRSQMNPHFIFNALNSVNHFISMSDERAANKFLAEFSRLMRLVLENSQKDFVPLSSEIEIVELYIKLEHYRFRDKFEYSFECDEEINADSVEIPPMLIQPYIENAVWHGLRYKEDYGKLTVKIDQRNEFIEVLVEDNGIGREKSQALKTKHQRSSKSTGLSNTSSRLAILNTVYGTNFSVELNDLDPESRNGTQVRLIIPTSQKISDYA